MRQKGRSRREIDEIDPSARSVFEVLGEMVQHPRRGLPLEEHRHVDVTAGPGVPAGDGTEDVREADIVALIQYAADVVNGGHRRSIRGHRRDWEQRRWTPAGATT